MLLAVTNQVLPEAMEQRMDALLKAQPMAREQLWREVWGLMELEMEDRQVVTWATKKEAKLMTRAEVVALRRLGDTDTSAYHAYMNPSGRRTGTKEFNILAASIGDGSLWRACDGLRDYFIGEASYAAVIDAMRSVKLWKGGGYTAVRWSRSQNGHPK